VWDGEDNVSKWSKPATFSIGILEEAIGRPSYIGYPLGERVPTVSPVQEAVFGGEGGEGRFLPASRQQFWVITSCS